MNDPIDSLPPKLREQASWLINAGADDTQRGLEKLTDSVDDIRVLTAAIEQEKSRSTPRTSRLKPMEAKLRKLSAASTAKTVDLIHRKSGAGTCEKCRRTRMTAEELATHKCATQPKHITVLPDGTWFPSETALEILAPSSLLDGAPNTSLSPAEVGALAAVETAWTDAARLAGLVKNYARAGTAAKALCGLRLRALREHYFGPRMVGRPKKSGMDTTWDGLLADRLGITRQAAENWMKMADAVEQLADRQGLDLRATCEKLPWDWTPEEAAAIEATVNRLTEDKTQRQLLQADFLSDLGYSEPERANASNNPTGKNGGSKQIPVSPQQRVENLRTLARTALFGHDSKEHRPQPGSPAFWMNSVVDKQGRVGDASHPAAALTKQERKEIYELLIKPFVDAWKALDV